MHCGQRGEELHRQALNLRRIRRGGGAAGQSVRPCVLFFTDGFRGQGMHVDTLPLPEEVDRESRKPFHMLCVAFNHLQPTQQPCGEPQQDTACMAQQEHNVLTCPSEKGWHNLVDPYHIWMPQGKEDRHLAHHLERDTLARIDKP
eukprot:scaffold187603_cov28-Tisochrysis_lutea.AAC.3